MSKRLRQYIGILAAVLAYYVIHEGAHLIVALALGTFKGLRFMGLGVQIDIQNDVMTDPLMFLFCIAGAVATFVSAWTLVLLSRKICNSKNLLFKAIMWYVTLALLLIDPVYLSLLCRFVGGGDMNGIGLLVPETAARLAFAAILVAHVAVVWKLLLPRYRTSFE